MPNEERQRQLLLKMLVGLALLLPLGGVVMAIFDRTVPTILLFVGAELIAYQVGYRMYAELRRRSPLSPMLRVARLLIHPDDRPPLPPANGADDA